LRIANKTTWKGQDEQVSIGTFWSYKDLDHPILFCIDQLSNDFGLNVRYDNTQELFGHRNHFVFGVSPVLGVVEDNRFANVLGNRGGRLQPSPFGPNAPSDSSQTSFNLDVYAQDRFYFLPQWALVAGAQMTYASRDNQDDFPVNPLNADNSEEQSWMGFSPKLGVLWEAASDVQGFLNVSRSFEPPSFGELVNANNSQTGLIDLDAQTATTIELGTRGRRGRVTWDLAFYHAWLDNELLQSQVAPGLSQTVNAGRTIHQGVEAGLDLDVLRNVLVSEDAAAISAQQGAENSGADRVVLRQTYLWSHFHFDGDAQFGSNQLAGIPEHYYRAELMYEHPCGVYAGPNLEWSMQKYNVDFAETLYADPYALVGFRLGWRNPRGFSVFLEGKNLGDKKYAATTNVIDNARGMDSQQFFPGDGRSFYAGVEWKW
jgi:iron complex outermembrane receptor protein